MPVSISRLTKTLPIVFSNEIENRIERAWHVLKAKDNRIYNGRLLRVCGKVDGESTIVPVAPDISYREVVGLRSYPDFLSWTPPKELFTVLSVIAFVETADGEVILLRRSSGDWETSLELPGCFITSEGNDSTIDGCITRCIMKDLSIPLASVISSQCIGHVDFQSICESMFVFRVCLSATFESLSEDSNIYSIPRAYTSARHSEFFEIPLHQPTKIVLDRYLDTIY